MAWVALGLQLEKENPVAWRSWERFLTTVFLTSSHIQAEGAKATGFLISPWHYTCLPTLPWESLTHDSPKHLTIRVESSQNHLWHWGFPAQSRGSFKRLRKDLVEISWLSKELAQRKWGRQTMPSPRGQSVGLTRDCRAMPLSSGNLDAYIWKHLLSFKEKNNPEACTFLFLPKLLLWSSPGGLGSPHSAGIWEDLGSSLSQPEGIAAHYFTSLQTQHCGLSWGENAASPSCCRVSTAAANLWRQREEQALRWSSRCPHPRTTVRSSMYGTKEELCAQKRICSPPPPTRAGTL